MKTIKTLILFLVLTSSLLIAQPPPTSFSDEEPSLTKDPSKAVIIEQAAPPVIINGKPADMMTDDEKKDFLQKKIRTINQEEGQVELLRAAPGYPLTVTFEESVKSVVVGDPTMLKVETLNPKTLVFTAAVREGDTSVQVFFSENRIRVFHVFVPQNFLDGETTVKVEAFQDTPGAEGGSMNVGYVSRGEDLDIRTITQIIRNYDALIGEKAIDSKVVKRSEVFRTSNITSFTTYYIYRFAGGPAAISFSYKNPFTYPVRYDESRLRIAIGNVRYVPDYVSLHRTTLAPGEVVTGFAVITKPVFTFDQPFELIWK